MIVAIAPTIAYVVAIATTGDASMSVDDRLAPTGVFLLRLALGIMYLAHSVLLKLLTFGLAGTAQFFVSAGLPAAFAYLTFTVEVVGGVLIVLGIQARWVALGLLPPLLGAIIWVHGANGWVFTAPGGGWEYPAYLIVASLAQALLGDGAFALMPSWGFASKQEKLCALQASGQGRAA
jgi:putative oxidoreductase